MKYLGHLPNTVYVVCVLCCKVASCLIALGMIPSRGSSKDTAWFSQRSVHSVQRSNMKSNKNSLCHQILVFVAVISIGLLGIGYTSVAANSPASVQGAASESVGSGNWSDPHVWSNGIVPLAGAIVTIRAGDTVVYDVVNDAVLGQVTIDGMLYFSRETNTRLKVGNHILVQPGGYLNMGTPTDYLPASIKAELRFVLTEAQANGFVGAPLDGISHNHHNSTHFESPDIGLWVFEQGRWDVDGAPLLRTWSKLAGDAQAGAKTVVVENNVGDWYVGGQIVLTSTRNPVQYFLRKSDGRELSSTVLEHEIRIVKAIEVLASGQTRITLDQPLAFAHAGTAPYQGEVALLTRNVVVSTELAGVDEATFADVRTRKFAHTMFMPGAKGNLQYGEFKRLGHYGKLGRYAIHHHRMLETSQGMIVRGNAIWETGFRCVNLHISHGVLLEDNVCYDSSSTAFFVEEDEQKENEPQGYQRGYNQDNVFVHNIAIATNPKHPEDRNNQAIAGEARRMGAFWPGSETQHEVYLGNIAVGGMEYTDGAGFSFPEEGNAIASQGQIPFTFVHNEVHSSASHGIFSWQNVGVARDLVDTLLWRNGDAGIRWGAYSMPAFYFNTKLLENGRSGLDVTSVNPFIQDSIIMGSQADGSSTDRGFASNGYVNPQYPNPGVWIVRNTFRDLQTSGVSQLEKVVLHDNINGDECAMHDFEPNPPFDLKQRPVWGAECSAFYVTLMGNQFVNVPRPFVFGNAANPNSWWKVFDYSGAEVRYDNFVLVRTDQTESARRGVITQKLVTSDAAFNANFDALVIPMASLPAEGIVFSGLLNHRPSDQQKHSPPADFIFTTQPNYPPTVSLDVTFNGKSVTMEATAADDRGIARIEYFVDWTTVATQTLPAGTMSTHHEVTIDLSSHPRKYAYLYVRVFDSTQQLVDYEQRAYSTVVEIGPEILRAQELPEEPSQPEEPKLPGGPGGSGDPIRIQELLLPFVKV